MAKAKKANYEAPATQVALEEGLKSGWKSDRVLSTAPGNENPEPDGNARDFTVEDNKTDDYIGTSPEYQNYANDTEAPYKGEGAEAEFLDTLATDDNESGEQSDEEEKEEDKKEPELKTGLPESESSDNK